MRFKNIREFLSYKTDCPLCSVKLQPLYVIDNEERSALIINEDTCKLRSDILHDNSVDSTEIEINLTDNSVKFTRTNDEGFSFDIVVTCPSCQKYHYTSNLLLFRNQKWVESISLFYEGFNFSDDIRINTFYNYPAITVLKVNGKYTQLPFVPMEKLVKFNENEIRAWVKRILILS